MNTETLDALETRDPAERERDLMARLPKLVALAKSAPGWARILDGVDAAAVNSRAALAALPVTRKADLKALQKDAMPFGGLNTAPVSELARVFISPGPIFDPEGRGKDWWRFARPLFAGGVRKGGLLQNCFSYHFTPAAFMIEGAAARIGSAVIPAGAGQTEMQVQSMADLKPDTYVGTPSFLRIIIEKAREMGADISSVRNAVMGAEALPQSLRAWFQANGVPNVIQTYASADIGSIAYETISGGAVNPGMVLDEDLIVEIVRPGSGEPVAPGDTGEVVVTSFNPDYPLIRFATGDMSALLVDAPPSPCGRTNSRIKGWMGRADQTTKVRAMFVHPSQVANIVRRHPEVSKARLVVSGRMANDVMTLHCELAGQPAQALEAAIVESIREVTKLRGEVVFAAPGSLPDDGKVIEDARDYT
ncbi:phenylacetate--CoA ligase family protein [Massilia cavernae]|uniref:Phenylacetate--CoA ligase family protein n=1 Tax=Massilia cavernae TaxID=2320864 RepID=A0A418XT86_9BURK|nr:AMP-binding protein [Massilia cavernae]RJG15883.1 phenylacetate--CoA ligase family protein [Massilia cavernae]